MILDFEQNDTQSILDSLLFIASNNWKMDQDTIKENMNKIAFHESDRTMDPTIHQYGGGPGRGLFQFEKNVPGKGQGAAQTAVRRLAEQLGYVPDFLKGLKQKNYDVSGLSPEQQQILFLGNLLQKPKAKKGNVPSSFRDVDTDEELAHYWATHHQAGTEPETDEYDTMIKKFLRDLQDY